MKKLIALLGIVAILVTMLVPAALANDEGMLTAWIKTANGGTLNLRETASKNAKVLTKLEYGSQVQIYPVTGSKDGWSIDGWCRVKTTDNKYEGYVMANYLSFTAPTKDDKPEPTYQDVDNACKALKIVTPYPAVIKTSRPSNYVHLRWIPNTNARYIDKYLCNTEIVVLAESKTWSQVQIVETGYVGFILTSCVQAQGTFGQ